jgi:peptidoglycan/LPS O-acetylase OafA/YrhL
VVPLYWVATAIYLCLKLLTGKVVTPEQAVQSFLFIPYAVPGSVVMRPIVGQGWTLNFEMFFYAIFALCLLLPKRAGTLLLLAAIPLLVAAGAALRPLVPYLDPITRVAFWTDPIMLMFLGGMLAGYWQLLARRWHALSTPLLAAAAVIAAATAGFLGGQVHFPLSVSWQLVFGAAAIAAVLLCTPVQGDSTRISPVLVGAGDASYSTYLSHPLVLAVLAPLWGRLPHWLDGPVTFIPAAVIVSNMFGYIIHRAMERPLIALFQTRRPPTGFARPRDATE